MRNNKPKININDILKDFNKLFDNYVINSTSYNLNKLLDIYQSLIPDWVEHFNDFNQELRERNPAPNKVFDEFLKVQLPKEYSVNDLKVSTDKKCYNIFDNIMQRGRTIHLSNKIAHHIDYLFDSKIRGYLYKHDIFPETPEDLKYIKRCIRQYYRPNSAYNVKQFAKRDLVYKFGFNPYDFNEGNELDRKNFPLLIKSYNNAMFIKDTEIENVNRLVIDNGRYDISYGLKEDDEYNTLFVMDIQRFGQFAVHVKNPDLISKIKVKYRMPLYRRETNFLVDHLSDKAKEFMEDAKNDASLDKERDIPINSNTSLKQRERLAAEIKFLGLSKAEKHEIAVKGGLIRRNLENIDSDEER